MTATESRSRQQRVQDALADLLDADEHSNSYRYFRASDVVDIDPELSPALVGSYLPQIEAESPLSSGLVVERYTERRCGASLWIVNKGSRMTECQHCGRDTERRTFVDEPLYSRCAERYEEYDQTQDVDQHQTTPIHEVTA